MQSGSVTDIKKLRGALKNKFEGEARALSSTEALVIDVLRSNSFAAEVRRCVPASVPFDVDRLLRVVQSELRRDMRLAACEPKSILGAVMQCAEIGLTPGFMGQAYLSARAVGNGSGAFQYEAQLIPGYRGLIALAKRGGEVKQVLARIVTDKEIEADQFVMYYEGERDILTHKPILFGDRGDPVLVYCLIRFEEGFQVEPMTKDEVLAIKEQALQRWGGGLGESAWITNEMEMWKKTVIRRAIKYLDIRVDGMAQALDLDDRVFGGESQNLAALASKSEAALRLEKSVSAKVVEGGGVASVASPLETEKGSMSDADRPDAGSEGGCGTDDGADGAICVSG